jgi:hypothetical protein
MGCECFPANEECPSAADCPRPKLARFWAETNDAFAEPHVTLPSGMVRSDDSGKTDYTLVDLAMLERWAQHLTRNVGSKGHNNWRLACSEEDLQRFRASAFRHFVQWLRGDVDEDHAAALLFNVAGAEHVRSRL